MKYKFLIILYLLFFAISFCFSQQGTQNTIKLDSVVVKDKKINRKEISVVPMQSLLQKQINLLSTITVADAIKNFSGVAIKDYGGIGGLKTVMIRSLGSQHTSVIVDGFQITETSSGQVDLGKISTNQVEEINLQIGNNDETCQPARSYASANTINIKFARPNFENGNNNFKINLKTGSFGLINPSVFYQQKINDKLFLSSEVNYTKSHGRYLFSIPESGSDSLMHRQNTDVSILNSNIKAEQTFKDNSQLNFQISYYYSDRGLPGAAILYNTYSSQRMYDNDFLIGLKYKSNTEKKLQWQTLVKFTDSKLRYIDPDYFNIQGFLDNTYKQNEYYLSQAFTYTITKPLKISASADVFVNTLKANQYKYANPIRTSNLLLLAANYNKPYFDINMSVLGTYVIEKTQNGLSAADVKKLSPSFSAGYKILDNPNIRLRFMYKDIFRMPTFNDLYYHMIGNVDLVPEKTSQFNFGVNSYINLPFFLTFKADIFYNLIDDKIVAIPTKNLFEWSMQNIGKVKVKGFETQLQGLDIMLFKNVKLFQTLTYTYQNSVDASEDSPTFNHQIPYIPFETFSSNTSIEYLNWAFAFSSVYNGHKYFLNENISANVIPSWWQNDFVITYKYKTTKKYSINIKGEISNIFNKQYYIVRNFPMPMRAYYITVSFNNF